MIANYANPVRLIASTLSGHNASGVTLHQNVTDVKANLINLSTNHKISTKRKKTFLTEPSHICSLAIKSTLHILTS